MSENVLQDVLSCVALLLLATILLGLVRIWRGPDLADRMLTAQLFGTAGIALLLVSGELSDTPALRNAALILASLAVISTASFAADAALAPTTATKDETRP